MAEVTLQAGAKLDMLNKHELRTALDAATRDWFNQVGRGDRYRRFSAAADIDTGTLEIGGPNARDANLGPADGFVWAVQRLAVEGLTTASGDPLTVISEPVQVFLNEASPSSLVHPALLGYQDFGQYSLVMYPGDTLLVTGTGLTSTGQITLTGQAREVPMPLAWRLGG